MMLIARPGILPLCTRWLTDKLAGRISQRELERRLREQETEQMSLGLGAADVGTRRSDAQLYLDR